MTHTFQVDKVASAFAFEGTITSITPTGNGHINDTYRITTTQDNTYILQRINHLIFKNPEQLMQNIQLVCSHLKEKIRLANGNPDRETLTVILSKTNLPYIEDETGCFWRAYRFIDHASSYDIVPDNTLFYNAAYAFGTFQKYLLDFDATLLHEVIPSFHHTQKRYNDFLNSLTQDIAGRAKNIPAEIQFVKDHEKDTSILLDLYTANKLPLRVTHNDTKINNVMIDDITQKGVCVIDLDTVMPGLVAYDFGDAIRTGATSGAEDEVDLSKVTFLPDRFYAFAKGFLDAVGTHLTNVEIDSLLIGAKVMTLECGIRFLADYLDGDTYFKTHHEHHNLDRARTQFKLVQDMECQWTELEKIIHQLKHT